MESKLNKKDVFRYLDIIAITEELQKSSKNFAEILAYYDEAIALIPDYYLAYYSKASYLGQFHGKKLWRLAIEFINKAIKLKPKYHALYREKAILYDNLQMPIESANAYDTAIKNIHIPENNQELIDEYIRRKAIVLYRYGKSTESIKAFNQLARRGSATPSDHHFQALNYLSIKKCKEAEKILDSIIKKIEKRIKGEDDFVSQGIWDIGEPYLLKAWLRFKEKKYEQAVKLIHEAEAKGIHNLSPRGIFPDRDKIMLLKETVLKHKKKGLSIGKSAEELKKRRKEIKNFDFPLGEKKFVDIMKKVGAKWIPDEE